MNNTSSMTYCPPNITFSEIWVKNGVSHCFLDTVTSATYGIFLLIFGIGQWLMYKKFATSVQTFVRPKSRLLAVQIFFNCFMTFISIIHIILLATVIGKFVSIFNFFLNRLSECYSNSSAL